MPKQSDYTICTLGSHSALQILKGAKDEGFQTLAVCAEGRTQPYESFKVADKIITIDDFANFEKIDKQLAEENVIMIPHASFMNAVEDKIRDNLHIRYFGNMNVLPWESDRTMQRSWLSNAGLTLPNIYDDADAIDGPVIIKFFGAAGGKGYFLAHTPDEFRRKIKQHADKKYVIQEYIVGAPIYIHYFYSPLNDELEVIGFDKRYESNVDSIGRISAKDQMDLDIETSYNITGNMPLVVRESLLPEIFKMGERVVEASREIDGRGLFGPFCLEAVITPDLEFFVFEISARIVAGMNPYVGGSPYTDLRYAEPMSAGRRIAREVKDAIATDQLDKVLG